MPTNDDKSATVPSEASSQVSFDPLNPRELKKALNQIKKPRDYKKYGQNFLLDKNTRDQIVAAARLSKKDRVLEIGPGSGVLTGELAKRAGQVVAVDIDPFMLKLTRLAVGRPPNLKLKLQDIRRLNLPRLFCEQETGPHNTKLADGKPTNGQYVVVGNLPFLLTGFILRFLTTTPCSPKLIVVMVQKEVAQRILSTAGRHSLLSLGIKIFGEAKLVTQVPRRFFWPQPKVDSSVIVITRHAKPLVPRARQDMFFKVSKAGFSNKRKKLANALHGGLRLGIDLIKNTLKEAKIPPNARAQELSVQEWALLSQKIAKFL